MQTKQDYIYVLRARNALIGIWDRDAFIVARYKFGSHYLDREKLYDKKVPGTSATPVIECGECPKAILDNEDLLLEFLLRAQREYYQETMRTRSSVKNRST